MNPGTDGSNNELLLSLSKNLLRSLETQEGLPNPSVHLALRLSDKHNKVKEAQYLKRLQTDLHNNLQRFTNASFFSDTANIFIFQICISIQFIFFLNVLYVFLSSLSKNEPVTGLMALYTLALKSSCDNGSTTTFTVNNKIQPLLTHLKKQMEQEKEHIHSNFSIDLSEAHWLKKCHPHYCEFMFEYILVSLIPFPPFAQPATAL